MPRLIQSEVTAPLALADAEDWLEGNPFEPGDETSLSAAASVLAGLAANRDFLGDLLLGQLKTRHSEEGDASAYGPQAIVLSPMRGNCFLRANIWPSEDEAAFQSSGASAFVYGVPHDHNFSFLTAGYFGPGYRSDYYEYEYEEVAGYAGESVALRFMGREALPEGKLMLYRAHRDIHSQLAPERLSVSLNIMHIDPAQGWYDQYGFDLEEARVTGLLNPTSTESFLRCAVALGSGEALDLAERFGRNHPSARLRLASYEARALLTRDRAGKDLLWREAELSGNLMLAKEATARRQALAS